MKAELIQEFKQEMDARGVGGDNYFNSKAILDKMDQFGNELLKKMGEKSTSATNTNFVSTSVNPLLNPANLDGPVVTSDLPLLYKESNDTAFNLYFNRDRGGIYHLPEKFMFPKMGLNLLIIRWFCGDKSKGIAPLAYIKRSDIAKQSVADQYSKMTSLMKVVQSAAIRKGCWRGRDFYKGNIGNCNCLFDEIKEYFMYPMKQRKNTEARFLQKTWRSIFNEYRRYGKKFAVDLD